MTNVFVDFQEFVVATLTDLQAQLNRMEIRMADNSQLLNEVADGLNNLGPIVAELLAENAELRGEDASESDAASRVKASFDDLASKFDSPEVPVDVDPLPVDENGNPV